MGNRGAMQKHLTKVRRLGKCSVLSGAHDAKGSCFPHDALVTLATAHNARSSSRIEHESMPPDRLWRTLHERSDCDEDELCLVKKLGMQYNVGIRRYIKPLKPQNLTWRRFEKTWLNTNHIENIMKHYDALYGDEFEFLGVYPVDFQGRTDGATCIGRTMCDFDVADLIARGKKSFAMVINTVKAHEPGEHWVAIWCGVCPTCLNYGIYYYDSNGITHRAQIPLQVRTFMAGVKRRMIELGHGDFEVHDVHRRHQTANGQCGMFSICFIVAMLCGHKFEDYVKLRSINDRLMRRLRKVFFI